MIKTLLRKCSEDERGTHSIEFALAAPLLFVMTCGIVELGTVVFVDVLMESGMRDAARYGVTGQAEGSDDRLAHILDIIEERTVGLVDMNDAEVSVTSYPSFDDIGRGEEFVDGNGNGQYDYGETFDDENGNGAWDDDVGEQGAGGSDQVVVYRINYDWPLMTPFISKILGDDKGNYNLAATVVVRNEPWN